MRDIMVSLGARRARGRVQRRGDVPARRTARSSRWPRRPSTATPPSPSSRSPAPHGIETGWFTLDGWRVAATGPGTVEEGELTGEPPIVAPDLPDGVPAPHKLMCIAVTPEQMATLAVLRERLPPSVTGVFSHPRYLEVVAPGVDKAVAVVAAYAALGVAPYELAAIGDAENDIGMLRAAGIGVAMGNAAPAVVAVADRVTAANDRDGAASAIEALLG